MSKDPKHFRGKAIPICLSIQDTESEGQEDLRLKECLILSTQAQVPGLLWEAEAWGNG